MERMIYGKPILHRIAQDLVGSVKRHLRKLKIESGRGFEHPQV
jgi:hypothetical protein